MNISFAEFYYLELLEGKLRIVKKAAEVNSDENSAIIGTYKEYEIIRTKHTKDNRGSVSRDAEINNEDYMNIVKKAFSKLESGYNSIIYKENERYNNIIIHKEDNKLRVITVIQQNRKNPTYKSKPTDNKFIIESDEYNINLIELY